MTAPAQRSPEWHAQRIGRVTGSNVGAILSIDPNRKRSDVLRAMVREALGAEKETQGDFVEDVIFGYGKINEDGALLDFQMDTGLEVEACGFFPYEDWLGASPDGLTSDGGVLEIKAPWSRRTKDEDQKEFKSLDEQPHYYAQMQIEMLCAGRDKAHFYQWSGHVQKHEVVPLDQPWLDENLPRLKQFWAEYMDELANNPDEHLLPRRITIDTPEAAKMVREYDELAEAIELATERKKDLLASMVEMAGGKNAVFGGRKLTLTQRQGAISYAKAIKELAPGANLEKWRGKASESWGLR